jgi:hypothetical protein
MGTGGAAAVLRAALDETIGQVVGQVVGQAEPLKSRGLHALRMRRDDVIFRSASSSRGKRHEQSSRLVSTA